jgi:hypothetical protein
VRLGDARVVVAGYLYDLDTCVGKRAPPLIVPPPAERLRAGPKQGHAALILPIWLD